MHVQSQLWVALDDTHAKTIDILLELQNDPDPQWEVVYEELYTADAVFDGVGESGLLFMATSRPQSRPLTTHPLTPPRSSFQKRLQV